MSLICSKCCTYRLLQDSNNEDKISKEDIFTKIILFMEWHSKGEIYMTRT